MRHSVATTMLRILQAAPQPKTTARPSAIVSSGWCQQIPSSRRPRSRLAERREYSERTPRPFGLGL